MNKPALSLILVFLFLHAIHAEHTARDRVIEIVSAIQRSDYEGDRTALKEQYDQLTPFLDDTGLASRVRYWRGFARWRDGINAGNESVDPEEIEKLLLEGADEFKAALALDPAFVDAKVGLISFLGYSVYFHRNEKERVREMVKPIYELVTEAKAAAPDNPRFIWVMAPILSYAPPEKGGGLDKASENNERGVALCSRLKPRADKLEPSWGKPELLMTLAYEYMTRNPPDLEKAEHNAKAALEIVPYWHYVRDILMTQIVAAKNKSNETAGHEQ
jgi:hypothetical protein